MDGLTALPQLEELDLRFNFDYQSEGFPDVFPLYQFSRLRRIAVVNVRGGDFFTDLTKQLAKVIVKSPLLEHLEYVWPKTFNGGIPRFKGQQNYIPHSMILGVPKEQNPFRRLAFQGRNIITKHTLSHLRHVSALSMSELAVSKYDNIWQILSAARIYLKDISVDTMDQHLVNYLMSYSGLEKFSIVYSRWSPVTESNPEAVQFYADALPRHRNSLTCLVISSTTPTNWCITGEYMSLVLKCRRLKELSVTLDFDEIHHVEAVKQVISKALELPHLRILNILTSGTRQRFGCGTGTIRYRAQTLHTLEGVIESLEIGKFVRGLELCRILAHQVEYVAGMADDGRMRFLKKRVAGDAGRRTDMFFF
ncbi:hypothetical protein B0H34DRAFT_382189 [Crassisporium funariophilum]|nr:hypothetical protein B0H34DRAFT_382189 [Crassisporium funariophilum]